MKSPCVPAPTAPDPTAAPAALSPLPLAGRSGQATIEFLGVLPFFVFAALACVQALLLGLTALYVQAAAGAIEQSLRSGAAVMAPAELPVPAAWRDTARISQGSHGVHVRLQAPSVLPGLGSRHMRVRVEIAAPAGALR